MDLRFDAIDVQFDSIDSSFERLESKLEATFNQVARNAEAIHVTSGTQERHESILEVLSKRSIEQESCIRPITITNKMS
ncbi:hypothetical protein [Paenibacillus sp. NPDC055715]